MGSSLQSTSNPGPACALCWVATNQNFHRRISPQPQRISASLSGCSSQEWSSELAFVWSIFPVIVELQNAAHLKSGLGFVATWDIDQFDQVPCPAATTECHQSQRRHPLGMLHQSRPPDLPGHGHVNVMFTPHLMAFLRSTPYMHNIQMFNERHQLSLIIVH